VNRAAAALGLLPGETTLAVTVTAVMLLTSTGAAMGGAATDALFFAHFDVAQLPLMYVALGAVTLAFTLAVSALLARPDRARLYAAIPLALGLVLVLERVLVATGAPWVFPAIWLAMNVVATLQGIVTWGVASSLTDTRQAKRLFPLFNAGRIGGSIVGGFGTTALAGVLHAENLIPIWAASLVAAFALIACGFLVKAAAVPFHFWLADAYAVAPTPAAIVFTGVMSDLGIYAVARIYWTVFQAPLEPHVEGLRAVLVGFAVVELLQQLVSRK